MNSDIVGGKSTRVILATLSSERQRNTGTIRSDLIAESVAKYAPKEGSCLFSVGHKGLSGVLW